MRMIQAADLFCGAGGTSSGIVKACHRMGYGLNLLAVNHWATAIATHSGNHPGARHMCMPLELVSPKAAIVDGHLDLLCASPECTHHSIARGGRPVSDQKRAGAWEVVRWASELRIDNIQLENVREFMDWGPVGNDGRPIQSKKGAMFRAFLQALRSLNYRVEHRVLNCADYGDPTSRRRLFILAKRGRGHIDWPAATHGAVSGVSGDLWAVKRQPYRTAREIIDWAVKGTSIFSRKRPLSPRTIDRIAAGLRKFGGAAAEPFLVMLYGTNDARSVDRPAPTVTANGQHVGLCEPYMVGLTHGGRLYDMGKPMPTVTGAHRGEIGLVEPFILPPEGVNRGNVARSLDAPLQTVLASRGGGALIEPFILPHPHAGKWANTSDPRSIDEPLPAITTTSSCIRVIEPFLVNYNGQGKAHSVGNPLDTVTTKDRFGLVEPAYMDILFRMLTPRELARAQGFPDDYQFTGTKADIVKQIGNAVPVNTAAALVEALVA